MQRETPADYELLVPHAGHTKAVPIAAQDDTEAIDRAMTYFLAQTAVQAATLRQGGRIVSHLSR